MTARLVIIALILIAGAAYAGSAASATFNGHVSVGYREVDVSGDEGKYRQHVNLEDGARLFDLGLVIQPGRDADSPAAMPDRVELNASGLGGDPYQSARLRVQRYGSYRFTYDHRSSDYFYEDLLLAPEDASVEQSTGGDFHHFDFERNRDTLALDLDLSQRAKLSLGFARYDKNGDSTTVLDVEREEFELDKPIDESLDRYDLGFTYDWDHVTVTVGQTWQEYDNDSQIFLPGFSPGSEPTEPTSLDLFFLDQPYGFTSSDQRLSVQVRPSSRWIVELDARAGDLDLDMKATERAQGTDYEGRPFDREDTGEADVDRKTLLLDASVAYLVNDRIQLNAGVRRYDLEQDGTVLFGETAGTNAWDIETTGFELGVDMAVTTTLTLSGGWSTEKRETVVSHSNDGPDETNEVDTDRDGFFARLSYRPNRRAQVTLSFADDRIDDPYTLASATDAQRYRARASYRWDNGLTVSASYRHTDYENDNTGWISESRQSDIRLTHASERLTVSVGASFVELEREVDQLVTGGFRQDLFAISYGADADFWDGAVRWHVTDQVDLTASYRAYDNEGSFRVDRDDVRAGVEFMLPADYALMLSYRNVDYNEDDLESFDVDVWELALKFRW
jgi:predicted porin